MAMRMTGLVSGMDTESMVKELVSASSEKVNKIKQKKQDVEWKKEIWSGLNTKIYNFYKTQLSAFKTVSNYKTKKATASDETRYPSKPVPERQMVHIRFPSSRQHRQPI